MEIPRFILFPTVMDITENTGIELYAYWALATEINLTANQFPVLAHRIQFKYNCYQCYSNDCKIFFILKSCLETFITCWKNGFCINFF